MDQRIQRMLDHYEIRQQLARYCRGCDRADEALMASVYADHSWDDHGHRSGEGKQFARDTVKELLETAKIASHLLGQSLIEVTGDTAAAETYFHATLIYPPEDQTDFVNHIAGRYVDKFVRDDGQWLIKDRLTIRDWSITHRVEADPLSQQGIVDGGLGPGDASYRALGHEYGGDFLAPARFEKMDRRRARVMEQRQDEQAFLW